MYNKKKTVANLSLRQFFIERSASEPLHQCTQICGELTRHFLVLPDTGMPAGTIEKVTVLWGEVETVQFLVTLFVEIYHHLIIL